LVDLAAVGSLKIVVDDMVDHVICVITDHSAIVYLAEDLAADTRRRWRLGVILVLILELVVLIVGGDDGLPVAVPVDVAEVAGAPVSPDMEKVSQFGDSMSKAGSRSRCMGRKARRRRISHRRSGPSRGTGGTSTQRLLRCHRARRFMSGQGTGSRSAKSWRANLTGT
jgi:hypothetical protein